MALEGYRSGFPVYFLGTNSTARGRDMRVAVRKATHIRFSAPPIYSCGSAAKPLRSTRR